MPQPGSAHRPPGDPDQKRRVQAMFDGVAHRYDLLNHLLSGGVDMLWRRRAIRELAVEEGDRILDLCTGTGDLGFEALRGAPGVSVVGLDLAFGMLARGRDKRDQRPLHFVQGDAEAIPLAEASVDRACVGFGIRNVSSIDAALAETARVLRPGGRFVILEFTTPVNPVFRAAYHAYFHRLLPWIGRRVSGHPDAYSYLPDSVSAFPDPPELARRFETAGFRTVRWTLVHGGIAAIHVGDR
jgi:demethylmenaquinone methyltransferase/2-methoxy-6-polyprenyl-1,4-benzoquinol methylase